MYTVFQKGDTKLTVVIPLFLTDSQNSFTGLNLR